MHASTTSTLHARFLVLLPKIETHGQIFFRHLKPHRKEEVLQETRALAWRWFLMMAERGKDAAEFINTFNTFLACAVKGGRRLTGREKAKDPMCEQTQRRHGFTVRPLPATQRGLLETVDQDDAFGGCGTTQSRRCPIKLPFVSIGPNGCGPVASVTARSSSTYWRVSKGKT